MLSSRGKVSRRSYLPWILLLPIPTSRLPHAVRPCHSPLWQLPLTLGVSLVSFAHGRRSRIGPVPGDDKSRSNNIGTDTWHRGIGVREVKMLCPDHGGVSLRGCQFLCAFPMCARKSHGSEDVKLSGVMFQLRGKREVTVLKTKREGADRSLWSILGDVIHFLPCTCGDSLPPEILPLHPPPTSPAKITFHMAYLPRLTKSKLSLLLRWHSCLVLHFTLQLISLPVRSFLRRLSWLRCVLFRRCPGLPYWLRLLSLRSTSIADRRCCTRRCILNRFLSSNHSHFRLLSP